MGERMQGRVAVGTAPYGERGAFSSFRIPT